MNQDYSQSNAAKHRFCCTCGHYCQPNETYFPEAVQCLDCWVRPAQTRILVIPIEVRQTLKGGDR